MMILSYHSQDNLFSPQRRHKQDGTNGIQYDGNEAILNAIKKKKEISDKKHKII